MSEQELPEGWVEAEFGDLLTELRNGLSPRPNLEPPGVPILRISAVRSGAVLLDDVRYLPMPDAATETHRLREQDLLFTRYNGSLDLLGVCGMVRDVGDRPLTYPDKLMRARVIESVVSPQFIELFFQSRDARKRLTGEAKSSAGQQGVSGADLKRQPVAVAPLPEQRRIVEKVEALLAEVNRTKVRLERVRAILKRFRQSVLAAACSGKLTEEWRDLNCPVGSRDSLPKRTTAPGDHDDLPQLPTSWDWVRFEQLISELRNGVSPKPSIDPPGVPLLRISAVRAGEVNLDDFRYLPEGDVFVAKFSLREGDLLFTRYNGSLELLGVCGMVRDLGPRPVLYPDKLIRVRFSSTRVVPEYIEVFFSSPGARERLTGTSKSSAGQQGISGADLKAQFVALPARAEQEEIIRRVKALMRAAEVVDKQLEVISSRTDKLPQAILSKALSGELVPTEAELARAEGRNFETASVLLDRVKNHGATQEKLKRGRKARS